LQANELNELSLQEREQQVMEELHGVAGIPPEESPERLEAALTEMVEELNKVPQLKRRVWDRAVWLRPQLLKDRKFLPTHVSESRSIQTGGCGTKDLQVFSLQTRAVGRGAACAADNLGGYVRRRYKPADAARKICKYFHYKLELWGEEPLVRPITLEDMSEDRHDGSNSVVFCASAHEP